MSSHSIPGKTSLVRRRHVITLPSGGQSLVRCHHVITLYTQTDIPSETPSCHHTLPSCGQSLLRNHIITHSTLGGTVPIGTPSCHHSLLPAGQYVSPAAQVLSLPSRRGCCNAGRSARCLRTAPWWGSASEAQNTSASTPHGLFLKGSSVYKTRQTDLCSEADDFHSNVMCTTTLKGHTLQEKFNYLKLNLS